MTTISSRISLLSWLLCLLWCSVSYAQAPGIAADKGQTPALKRQTSAKGPSQTRSKRVTRRSTATKTPKAAPVPSRKTRGTDSEIPYVPPIVYERPPFWKRLLYRIFSFWPWLLILALFFGLPFLTIRTNNWRRRRTFMQARRADLANPLDASARHQLAEHYIKNRRYRVAQRYMEEAIEIQKKTGHFDPRMLATLGDILRKRGLHEKAIEHYKHSLELEEGGGQGEVFIALGAIYQKQDKPEEAQQWLEKAIRANSSRAEPVYRLAILYEKQEKTEESQKLIKEFLKDAHALPRFIKKLNRVWVLRMHTHPLSYWLFPI